MPRLVSGQRDTRALARPKTWAAWGLLWRLTYKAGVVGQESPLETRAASPRRAPPQACAKQYHHFSRGKEKEERKREQGDEEEQEEEDAKKKRKKEKKQKQKQKQNKNKNKNKQNKRKKNKNKQNKRKKNKNTKQRDQQTNKIRRCKTSKTTRGCTQTRA